MLLPLMPPNEEERLAALAQYGILDTEDEKRFDDLASLAAQICGTPIALVSFVDRCRQWFKARIGLDARETTREVAFCAHAILGVELLEVPDASEDERFDGNPFVLGDPKVRFYAGAPLITPSGQVLGTLCVVDFVPRRLTEAQKAALLKLAAQVVDQLTARMQLRQLELKIREAEQAKLARQESDRKLRALFDFAPLGSAFTSTDGRWIKVNPALCNLLGYSESELVDVRFLELTYEEDRAEDARLFAEVLRGDIQVVNREKRYRRKDGSLVWVSMTASAIRDESGAISGFAAQIQDITLRKRAEAALERSERSFRRLVQKAPVGIVVSRERTIEYVNAAFLTMFGYDDESEVVGMEGTSLVHPDELEASLARYAALLQGGELDARITRAIRRDGTIVFIEARTITMDFGSGPAYVGLIRDVTRAFELEEARQRAEEALRASLGEKDVLLKELHHRVKNNLQVIASLLNLQYNSVDDLVARAAFNDTRARVQAIALLHEKLYRADSLRSIDMRSYLDSIAGGLARTHADRRQRVAINVEGGGVAVDVDTAVPVGLIVNELITNAFKHAFPVDRKPCGSIHVRVSERADKIELLVSDDGVGRPSARPLDVDATLGMSLISSLASQLEGEVSIDYESGVRCSLTFPKPKAMRESAELAR